MALNADKMNYRWCFDDTVGETVPLPTKELEKIQEHMRRMEKWFVENGYLCTEETSYTTFLLDEKYVKVIGQDDNAPVC